MLSIAYYKGDLLNADLPAWGHGVNLEGVMGSGIARQVKAEYPEAFHQYIEAVRNDTLWAGAFQAVETRGTVVYNLATQIKQGPNADYDLILTSVFWALGDLRNRGIDRFGLPKIGCGIGGLDWKYVEYILNRLQLSCPEVQICIYEME